MTIEPAPPSSFDALVSRLRRTPAEVTSEEQPALVTGQCLCTSHSALAHRIFYPTRKPRRGRVHLWSGFDVTRKYPGPYRRTDAPHLLFTKSAHAHTQPHPEPQLTPQYAPARASP